MRRLALSALALASAMGSALATPADLPRPLATIVKAARLRPTEHLRIAGRPMEAIRVFSDLPYLLWTDDTFVGPELARDPEVVRRWLASAVADLGLPDLEPVFRSIEPWQGVAELWRYGLQHDGRDVWDWDLQVYWQGERLIGLVSNVPGPVATIATGGAADATVLLPRRLDDGGYALDRAVVARTRVGDLERTTVTAPTASFSTFHWSLAPSASDAGAQRGEWTEWALPAGYGTFPDQIDTDSKGRPWFSEPNSNQILLLRPKPGVFEKFPVTTGNGPDGLIVASNDLVYSGLYYSGSLGVYDPQTNIHQSFAAPYSGAALAIPTETSKGTIVVTDHSGRVLEWDPTTQTWIKNVTTPSSSPHIVAGVEDDDERMWFTEYNVNKLARFDLNTGQMTEIAIPGGGGPAFPAYHAGKVWFSLWSLARIGNYDIATGAFTFYTFSDASETAGPFFGGPNGDMACATKNRGYVVVYRSLLDALENFAIPTAFPGMKDGLTVGADGTVWITESSKNRIGRLVYPH